MLKQYPSGLPVPLKADRAFQMVDPLVSSASANGQTRWDRQFTDVPTATPVTWLFNDLECQAFVAWHKDAIRDGADWFTMPLRTEAGRHVETCHFIAAYSGPTRSGYDRWRIEAQLLLRRRPILNDNDGNFPDDVLTSELFDKTINWEWPSI
jgi:hypothetical protein